MTAGAESTVHEQTSLLHAVTEAAGEVFKEAPRRRAAVTYLRQRGIDSSELSSLWVVGCAPPGWTRLVDQLRGDFSDQALLDAGVARRSSRGTLIDTFRDRVIFGIHGDDGRLAGFIGRDLSGNPTAPKYLNTRQHRIFDKSALLYGLYEGTHEGESARQPVVVEGPLDVLAIAARGHRDAGARLLPIASCGTAFTAAQAQRVAELAAPRQSPVAVAMDGDTAGRTASLAAGEHLRLAELDVRVAILPNGSDPAAYLAPPENGLDVFRADHGLPLITARLEHAIAQQGDTIQWIEGRLNALRRVARYVATYPPDLAARQVTGIASALKLDVSTVTAEIVGSFDRGRTVARPALRTGVIDL